MRTEESWESNWWGAASRAKSEAGSGAGPEPAPQTSHVTPAMEAGVADHVWSTEEIVALLG